MIWTLYVKSQSIASTSNTTFWWALQTQTEWVIFEPVRTHHLGLKAQNFEKPIFTFGCFSLKTVYNSFKLQRVLQVAKFLFMYSFTTLLSRHLPTEIVIFLNICYQIKCICWVDVIYVTCLVFLKSPWWPGFANIPPTYFISCKVQTRYSMILKYSQQYIWDHLSGNKVKIWICSAYDAVFNSSCIASCNLTKTFPFSFISFLS